MPRHLRQEPAEDYDTYPATTGEMRAIGLDVDLRDAFARWAADPDDPIDEVTWRGYAPSYRALLRRQADKLFAMPEIRALMRERAPGR